MLAAKFPPLHRVMEFEERRGANLARILRSAGVLRFLAILGQFVFVVGIDRPAELHPVVAAQRLEKATDLSVEINVELIRRVRAVGTFHDEAFRHDGGKEGVEALAKDDESVFQESVGTISCHGSKKVWVARPSSATRTFR